MAEYAASSREYDQTTVPNGVIAQRQKQTMQFEDNRDMRQPLQRQTQQSGDAVGPAVQRKSQSNLPQGLKSGMEAISGHNLDDVNVHYNSPKPAAIQAHAFAQGTEIHLGAGQEKHLPHELGHVVQQKSGDVPVTKQLKGKVGINDDPRLEADATRLGERALQVTCVSPNNGGFSGLVQKKSIRKQSRTVENKRASGGIKTNVFQRATWYDPATESYARYKRGIKVEEDYSDKEANKLVTLHQIADEIKLLAGGVNVVGPHIAVSIYHKKMYIAINERFAGNLKANGNNPEGQNNLQAWSEQGVKAWLIKYKNDAPSNIFQWVDSVKNNILIIQNKNTTNPKDASGSGAWHGEIAIADYLHNNFQEYEKSAPAPGLQKAIHIGGTQTNCFSCFVLLHGQLNTLNDTLNDQVQTGNYDTQNSGGRVITSSYQHQYNNVANQHQYKLLTGGTHGGIFPGANHLGSDTNTFTDHTTNPALDAAGISTAAQNSRFHQSNDDFKGQGYQIRLTEQGAVNLVSRIKEVQSQIKVINEKRESLKKSLGNEQVHKKKIAGLQQRMRGINTQLMLLKKDLRYEQQKVTVDQKFVQDELEEPVQEQNTVPFGRIVISVALLGASVSLIVKLVNSLRDIEQ